MMRIAEDLQHLATDITKIHVMPGNPRMGDVTAVARSLVEFGQVKPIVVQRSTGDIIAGNHTFMAAVQLDATEIAVVFVDMDDVTARAYALADNRTAELGGYDQQALADMIAMVAESADASLFAATGYDDDYLNQLLAAVSPQAVEPQVDPDDADLEPPPEPITQPGDVWSLGPHLLVCGDSTREETWLTLFPGDERADMIWSDPPYGVAYVGKTKKRLEIQNDATDAPALTKLLRAAFEHAISFTSPGSPSYIAGPSGPPMCVVFGQVLLDLGLFRQQLIWVKDSFVLGHGDYHYRHEPLFVGYTPGGKGRRGRGGAGWQSDHSQDTVWEIARPKRSTEHPTMKPVELVQRAMNNSSKRNSIVVDPFCGSGTTLIAAHISGRIGRGIELDPGYCDVIARRYQLVSGELPARNGEPYRFPSA
jgi:DNA modification methylase